MLGRQRQCFFGNGDDRGNDARVRGARGSTLLPTLSSARAQERAPISLEADTLAARGVPADLKAFMLLDTALSRIMGEDARSTRARQGDAGPSAASQEQVTSLVRSVLQPAVALSEKAETLYPLTAPLLDYPAPSTRTTIHFRI